METDAKLLALQDEIMSCVKAQSDHHKVLLLAMKRYIENDEKLTMLADQVQDYLADDDCECECCCPCKKKCCE